MKKLLQKLLIIVQNYLQPITKFYFNLAKTPYGRLIRMESYWVYPLLFLPSWIAIWLSHHENIMKKLLISIFFALGSWVTRSIGCIINDLFDIKFDKKVERTKNRPLANGLIKNQDAINFLIILSTLASILLLSLPKKSIITGLLAGVMIIIYPLAKRFTFLPQVILGLTFNAGVIIAWFTIQDSNFLAMFMIYLGSAFFTIGYDTIYACQDLEDDKKIGVKSLPLLLQKKQYPIKKFVLMTYQAATALIGLGGLIMKAEFFFYITLGLASYNLYVNLEKCDINKKRDCSEHFKSCANFLFLVFLGTW
jgi:4-hydroxybenzoate polyprenyltransferase